MQPRVAAPAIVVQQDIIQAQAQGMVNADVSQIIRNLRDTKKCIEHLRLMHGMIKPDDQSSFVQATLDEAELHAWKLFEQHSEPVYGRVSVIQSKEFNDIIDNFRGVVHGYVQAAGEGAGKDEDDDLFATGALACTASLIAVGLGKGCNLVAQQTPRLAKTVYQGCRFVRNQAPAAAKKIYARCGFPQRFSIRKKKRDMWKMVTNARNWVSSFSVVNGAAYFSGKGNKPRSRRSRARR